MFFFWLDLGFSPNKSLLRALGLGASGAFAALSLRRGGTFAVARVGDHGPPGGGAQKRETIEGNQVLWRLFPGVSNFFFLGGRLALALVEFFWKKNGQV